MNKDLQPFGFHSLTLWVWVIAQICSWKARKKERKSCSSLLNSPNSLQGGLIQLYTHSSTTVWSKGRMQAVVKSHWRSRLQLLLLVNVTAALYSLSLEREQRACSTARAVSVMQSLLHSFFRRASGYKLFAISICLYIEKLMISRTVLCIEGKSWAISLASPASLFKQDSYED